MSNLDGRAWTFDPDKICPQFFKWNLAQLQDFLVALSSIYLVTLVLQDLLWVVKFLHSLLKIHAEPGPRSRPHTAIAAPQVAPLLLRRCASFCLRIESQHQYRLIADLSHARQQAVQRK